MESYTLDRSLFDKDCDTIQFECQRIEPSGKRSAPERLIYNFKTFCGAMDNLNTDWHTTLDPPLSQAISQHDLKFLQVQKNRVYSIEALRDACLKDSRNDSDIVTYSNLLEMQRIPSTQWLLQSGHVPVQTILNEADKELFSIDKPVKYMSVQNHQEDLIKTHILSNIQNVFDSIPHSFGDDLTLIPAQILAIYHATTAYPFERVIEATFRVTELQNDVPPPMYRDEYRRRVLAPHESYNEVVRIPPNEFQRLQILCYGTGSGKTIMTTISSLLLLIDPVKWNHILKSAVRVMSEHNRENESGLIRGSSNVQVARLVICFVPKAVLKQWEVTANDVKKYIQRHFGMQEEVQVWVGHLSHHSIENCLVFGNKPTIWFLGLETKSIDVLFQTPHISFAALVYDEFNASVRKQSKEKRSIPIGPTYVAQATIDSLEIGMQSNPSHPIRQALLNDTRLPYSVNIISHFFNGSKNDDYGLILVKHLVMRMMISPFFIRSFMTKNCVDYMPRGLDIIRLMYRRVTLAGQMQLNDALTELNITSLDVFIQSLLNDMHIAYDLRPTVQQALEKMKDGIEGTVESLKNLGHITNNESIKSCFRRIGERLQAESIDCIICLGTIESRGDMCIVGCCTAVYCKPCLELTRQQSSKCAHCRAPNFTKSVYSAEPGTQSNPQTQQPPLDDGVIPPEASIEDAMKILSVVPKPLITCFVEAIQVLVRAPKSRVVVFCNLLYVQEFETRVLSALPPGTLMVNMKTISTKIKQSSAFMEKFNDNGNRAVVALCDRSTNSKSIAGIDFKNATSMIIDSLNISDDLQQQLIGRVLRMNTKNKNGQSEYIPIVLATSQ